MTRLTKRSCDTLLPTEKEYFVWDDQIKGFGIRVYPSGGKRYIAQTFRQGKTTRVQIGKHGTIAFDEAKRRAKKIIMDIDDGLNPNELKKKERISPNIQELADRFLNEYVPSHCKPRTQVEYKHAIKKYISPQLGKTKVLTLTREQVADFHHQMKDTPYQANRTLGVLSKMLNQAEVWEYRPDRSNPCYHVKKFKEQKRERYLNEQELICLNKALEQEAQHAPSAANAFRLLILTGARLSEIQTLKWHYIQGDRIQLPDSKTGSKTLYLGKTALILLGQIQRISGNPYVITGKQEGAYLTDLQKPWRRVRKCATLIYWQNYCEDITGLKELIQEGASFADCQKWAETESYSLPTGLNDVRIHDLRHTFASNAVMQGESLPMIGKLLGHTQPQTTARYAHLADDPLQTAIQRIDQTIKEIMTS